MANDGKAREERKLKKKERERERLPLVKDRVRCPSRDRVFELTSRESRGSSVFFCTVHEPHLREATGSTTFDIQCHTTSRYDATARYTPCERTASVFPTMTVHSHVASVTLRESISSRGISKHK